MFRNFLIFQKILKTNILSPQPVVVVVVVVVLLSRRKLGKPASPAKSFPGCFCPSKRFALCFSFNVDLELPISIDFLFIHFFIAFVNSMVFRNNPVALKGWLNS